MYKLLFIISSGIKVPNAVIVSGLLESPEDEEIIDFLKKYGSIRLVPVTDINSGFYKNLIIEYQDGAAIEALAPLCPTNIKDLETIQMSSTTFKLWQVCTPLKLAAVLPKPTLTR